VQVVALILQKLNFSCDWKAAETNNLEAAANFRLPDGQVV